MALKTMYIGKHVIRWKLYTSLLMIFAGSVVAAKFDGWFPLIGGIFIAVVGCHLNQQSIEWLREGKD
ncbi:hypothetical protein ES703_115488 [subsurface metagenome]